MNKPTTAVPVLITFDIFGTVLDWRSGLSDACARAGRPLQAGEFDRIVDLQGELERGPFRTYAEITKLSLMRAIGLPEGEAARIGEGVGSWPLYPDSAAALRELLKRAPCAAMTNSDTAHGAEIRKRLGFGLSDWLCAEEARVYKPDPRFWRLMAQRRGVEPGPGWWHVSAYTDYDLAVAKELGLTTVFVARPHARPGPASHKVSDLAALVRLLPLLLLLCIAPIPGSAEPPVPVAPPGEAVRQVPKKPEARLIREAFQSQFSADQLAKLGKVPTVEQLAARMTPEQRQGARAKLGELEKGAASPAELEQIGKGYLILDEHSPEAGQSAVRIAGALREMEPGKSAGFTLAAGGFQQMGDYPAAADWARKALELDPDDAAAQAVLMLSVGRVKRGGAGISGAPGTGSGPGAVVGAVEWSVPDKGASPQAIRLMEQAVLARRGGDLEKTRALAQAAMNADPTSSGVQKFYGLVESDTKTHAETAEFLKQSKAALDAGRGAEAVMWAQKAADQSKHPTVYKILERTRQRSEELARESAAREPPPGKGPAGNRFPLWPLGAGAAAGLAAIGYGAARSRGAGTRREPEGAPSEGPNSERMRKNGYRLKVAAVSLAVGFGIVYGGPIVARTAVPVIVAAWRSGSASFQRIAASNAGAINPSNAAGVKAAVGTGDHIVLGLAEAGLSGTAARIGARHLLADAKWQESLRAAIGDPRTRFTISLDGFSGANAYSKLMGAAQRGLAAGARPTDWEVGQLYQAGRLGEATIMVGGQVIQNPLATGAVR